MARSAVTSGNLGKVAAEIGIEGLDQIKANIAAAIDRSVGEEAKKVFMEAAMVAVNEAKDLVPVKTGTLKSAIFASYGDKKKPNVLVGVNHKKAPHAHLVEYGHGGPHPAKAHPFFRPAVNAAKPTMAVKIVEGLQNLIAK